MSQHDLSDVVSSYNMDFYRIAFGPPRLNLISGAVLQFTNTNTEFPVNVCEKVMRSCFVDTRVQDVLAIRKQ